MGLLKPTPGEIYDRISILDLKIKHKGGKHFAEEKAALSAALMERILTVPILHASDLRIVRCLSEVNGRLWDLEDSVRITPDLGKYVQITRLNDIRALLVAYINSLFGLEAKEKLHQ